MSKEKVERSTWQNIVSGSVAGGAEVLIDHPLWTIKTRMQSGENFSFNPRVLYRGLIPNAASMIPITATQVALNGWIKNQFHTKKRTHSLSTNVECIFSWGWIGFD